MYVETVYLTCRKALLFLIDKATILARGVRAEIVALYNTRHRNKISKYQKYKISKYQNLSFDENHLNI